MFLCHSKHADAVWVANKKSDKVNRNNDILILFRMTFWCWDIIKSLFSFRFFASLRIANFFYAEFLWCIQSSRTISYILSKNSCAIFLYIAHCWTHFHMHCTEILQLNVNLMFDKCPTLYIQSFYMAIE